MANEAAVRPNKRGVRSREALLDGAERAMAEHGYDGASISRIVEAAGVPASSAYHYFGSKQAILVAVMERGARRFHESVPDLEKRVGTPMEHLELLTRFVAENLTDNPDFLRVLIVLATQPRSRTDREVTKMLDEVRELALSRLRTQFGLIFEVDPAGDKADRLARFSLALVEGAFIAENADPSVALSDIVESLPTALVALAGTDQASPA